MHASLPEGDPPSSEPDPGTGREATSPSPRPRVVPVLDAATRLLVDPVLAVVFPSRCPVCRSPLARPTRGPLCASCWDGLPRHRGSLCGCGVPLGAPQAGECGRCRRGLNPLSAGASLGPYEGPLRTVIHELKYRGRRRAAARLAEAMVAQQAVRRLLSPGVVLIPVPLHPRRRRERGFNQAEIVAREVGHLVNLPVSPLALVRRKDTPPQTGLSASERRKSVAGAFAVRRRCHVAGKVVVLVDDVLTTGATALACARALRDAGAAEVRVLTVARVS